MVLWETKHIKDLGRVVTGKTPPKVNDKYFENGEELFVSPKDLDWDQFYVTKTKTAITDAALQKFKNQVIPKNTIMFTSLSFAFGKMGIASRNCLTNQQINSVIVNAKHDYRFVYYLFKHYRPIIFSYNSGIDTPIVPKSVFESIEIMCPPLSTQKKIAALLSAYDDLIENNKRRIALLEKMAEEIYREWFVRFRFPGYQDTEFKKGVPKEWSIHKLGDILELLYGKALKVEDRIDGKYPVYGSSGIVGSHHKPLIKRSGIIVGRKGNVGSVHWSDEPFFPIDTVYYVKSKISSCFLYFLLQSMNFINNDAAVPGLNRNQAYSNQLLLPKRNLILQFHIFLNPIFDQKNELKKINKSLSTTKEMLLSRLISGKFSVEDLDIQFPPSMMEEELAS